MTQEERELKLLEMQQNAVRIDEERNKRLYSGQGSLPTEEKEQEVNKKDARFLKDLNKQVYMDSEMGLEERLNRKAHYVDRHSARD